MFKFINNLTVSNRLRLIAGIILLFSMTCVFLLWNMSSLFNSDSKTVDDLTSLELRVWQIRNNYNSMRGDIMQVFISDPLTQQAYIDQASNLLRERVQQINEYRSGIRKDEFDADLATAYAPFEVSLQTYIDFCINNLGTIQHVQLNDSVEFNRVRNLLVVDLDKRFHRVRALAIDVVNLLHTQKTTMLQQMEERRMQSLWFTIALSVALLVITLVIIFAIRNSIIAPIGETEQILERLSAGELPTIREHHGKDEFSRMLRSLRLFNSHIHRLMEFAHSVAQNNFNVQATMFEGQGPIAASLVSMRDGLQAANLAETRRTWSSQGLAELGELIRRQENGETLYDKALSFIVKYLSASQGVLYIIDDRGENLEQAAAYAYGKKKHTTAVVGIGEGLVGQAFLEKGIIHLKQVPADYVRITSGLGEALPRELMISPLVSNGEVYGVLEIASFRPQEQHQIEFLKKISEELAVIIQSTRVNTKTQRLLQDSQQQAEELKAQEEEMRQNMEELQATQEGMNRVLKDVQNKEAVFQGTLEALPMPVVIFDEQYTILQLNRSMRRIYASQGRNVEIGANLSTLSKVPGEIRALCDRALQGEAFQHTRQIHDVNGATVLYKEHYTCVRNETGTITAGLITVQMQ
jgi:PAS domain-containing protein